MALQGPATSPSPKLAERLLLGLGRHEWNTQAVCVPQRLSVVLANHSARAERLVREASLADNAGARGAALEEIFERLSCSAFTGAPRRAVPCH